jgi:hypothetical protein
VTASGRGHIGRSGREAEAISVALLMGGGPASVYGPRAWAAYQELAHPEPGESAVAHAV